MNICLTDPSKSYVIAGSEEANEELRKKFSGDFDFKLPEGAIPAEKGFTRFVLTSENYNDIMKIKGIPPSCLSGDYGGQITKKAEDVMRSYYAGELSAEDVQQKIKNTCMDMRIEMVQERRTDGYNAKDNRQILEKYTA